MEMREGGDQYYSAAVGSVAEVEREKRVSGQSGGFFFPTTVEPVAEKSKNAYKEEPI